MISSIFHFMNRTLSGFLILMTCCCLNTRASDKADTARIYKDLKLITQTSVARNYLHPEQLDEVAAYIYRELKQVCDTVYYQPYTVNGTVYRNVVGQSGPEAGPLLVIGAHYDVAGEQQGADDNASGVAGLLELARIMKGERTGQRIQYVAYTLEEPPYFRTKQMGSYIHAGSRHAAGTDVTGMICLEMIGYFKDEPDTQDYPVISMKKIYGSTGNYITVVQKMGKSNLSSVVKNMKDDTRITTKSLAAPLKIEGIDFSDHLNYWHFGYDAIMITDTAFYRNKNYHRPTDTLDSLDIGKMALVVDELYSAILNME